MANKKANRIANKKANRMANKPIRSVSVEILGCLDASPRTRHEFGENSYSFSLV